MLMSVFRSVSQQEALEYPVSWLFGELLDPERPDVRVVVDDGMGRLPIDRRRCDHRLVERRRIVEPICSGHIGRVV